MARREAAPAVLVAALADVVLAFVSAWRGWHLYQGSYWWVWLLLALPALALFVVFLLGLGRLGVSSEHRRKVAITLLGAVAFANLAGIALVIVSLLNGGGNMTGGQLLASAVVVLLVNIITFGLIFWELDCGGPVRRLSSDRARPDFQFPQDDNPQLARTRLEAGPRRLPLRRDDELDRVQPDGLDAADEAREAVHELRVGDRGESPCSSSPRAP